MCVARMETTLAKMLVFDQLPRAVRARIAAADLPLETTPILAFWQRTHDEAKTIAAIDQLETALKDYLNGKLKVEG